MSETTVINSEQGTTAASPVKPDVMEQLAKPEVQQALTSLVDQLPKLTEMMSALTKCYDFAQQVASDKVLIHDTVEGIAGVVKPLGEKAKSYASAAIEASDRAAKSEATYSAFGLLKMLKDPELQKMLRFTQAFLSILGERNRTGGEA
ncbi:DUF1641 domain-containing protein [Gorillibacterium massiliense]|uniref:DUF1641 domain-containing protein n=1 Tax=Gorillibacterium massiliense TaxID=1280390 RepID=UPI0004B6917B|nr:DUF1641 domain-containing protein [Gorillibacterium massiliense]